MQCCSHLMTMSTWRVCTVFRTWGRGRESRNVFPIFSWKCVVGRVGGWKSHNIFLFSMKTYVIRGGEGESHNTFPIFPWKHVVHVGTQYSLESLQRGEHDKVYFCVGMRKKHLSFSFVLRFYGPVNPMGSCRARSVYLTTHLLGRLSPLSR